MTHPETLYLLDGMALAYRAYFALISRPLINSKGVNTSAIYGFVTTLMKILEDESPDHVAVVFDTPQPTFRHERYPLYKATREKMPEDMASQLGLLKDVVRAFRVPLLEVPGFEADDVIGTLARRAEKEGVRSFLVTGDKDFMQLISPLIRMYKPGKAGAEPEIVDEGGVREKFGVTPDRVIEVLGLTGDKSDNVPGVPGIGEKTAIPLIQQYGSIAEVYNHLGDIPQKGVREKLSAHRELAILSRELVTIHTDVPLALNFHELRAAPRDTEQLLSLFGELEFRSLAARLHHAGRFPEGPTTPPGGAAGPTPSLPTADISTDPHRYHCITDAADLDRLCSELKGAAELVIDTETTSTDAFQAVLVGLALCRTEREAWYVPVRTESASAPSAGGPGLFGPQDGEAAGFNNTAAALPLAQVLAKLGPLLSDPEIPKIGQNIKYDMLVLARHGVEVRGVAFDTMVASYILRADGQHNLDALALEYCNYRMVSYDDVVGTGKNRKSITAVPLKTLAEYSAEDADFTMRIFHLQRERLEQTGLDTLCSGVEFPLIPVLTRMERAGVALDVTYLEQMSKDLERQLDNLVKGIHRDAGEEFNINSTQQLAAILFTKLNLPSVRKTKTGFSTDVNVLESLRGLHPIIDGLLEYRQLTKLKSTYIDALPTLIHPDTNRVHTSFNQTVAATGRLSSSDPNLQNIPIRTEIGSAIRRAFIAGAPDTVMLSADYSQIELRIMAHISGDAGLVEAFHAGEDIHASTAGKVFGVGRDDVTRDMRRKAKEVNFGIMYGIGPFGLANRLDITQTEAREIITRYFERFPRVKQYIQDTIETARRTGYVATLLGRRRYLPDVGSRNQNIRGNAERQAINMPIQGTAADMIKKAMISIDHEIINRSLKSRMLLQVHDELVFEAVRSEMADLKELVIRLMKSAMVLTVPIEVDVGVGANWLEAH